MLDHDLRYVTQMKHQAVNHVHTTGRYLPKVAANTSPCRFMPDHFTSKNVDKVTFIVVGLQEFGKLIKAEAGNIIVRTGKKIYKLIKFFLAK